MEPVGLRLEAMATRVEAIPIRFFLLLGWRPSLELRGRVLFLFCHDPSSVTSHDPKQSI